ncbi:MAG: hypothetical protein IPH23_11025 [Gammaproteobacteria bacterium]|nr:hypothetical protein [Gammaproteobacteria bacterium]
MLSIGPVPMTLVLILLALACAAGLLARPAFILKWWPQYAAAPWAIVRIHDGGFVS